MFGQGIHLGGHSRKLFPIDARLCECLVETTYVGACAGARSRDEYSVMISRQVRSSRVQIMMQHNTLTPRCDSLGLFCVKTYVGYRHSGAVTIAIHDGTYSFLMCRCLAFDSETSELALCLLRIRNNSELAILAAATVDLGRRFSGSTHSERNSKVSVCASGRLRFSSITQRDWASITFPTILVRHQPPQRSASACEPRIVVTSRSQKTSSWWRRQGGGAGQWPSVGTRRGP